MIDVESCKLVDEIKVQKARYRVVRWLGYRSRSKQETEAYLKRKGYAGVVVETVLAEMEAFGYIDDARFAGELIRVYRRRDCGPIRARWELRKKGVAEEIIDSKLAEHFSPEEDLYRVRSILEKRSDFPGDAPDERWIRRQVSFLKRRGFQDAVIVKALQRYCRVCPEEEPLS